MSIDGRSEVKALQESIQKTKVRRGADLSFEERIAAGPQLFDDGLRLMRDFIRAENPDWTPDQVEEEVDRRLRIARRMDDADLYQQVDSDSH